jgi:hypothetical protein
MLWAKEPMVQLDLPKKMNHQSLAKLKWTLQPVPQQAFLVGLEKKNLHLHLF